MPSRCFGSRNPLPEESPKVKSGSFRQNSENLNANLPVMIHPSLVLQEVQADYYYSTVMLFWENGKLREILNRLLF